MIRGVVALAAALGLCLTGTTAAGAATLFNHNNYIGFLWAGTTSPGGLGPVNDMASSIVSIVPETYCENWNCAGRKLWLPGSVTVLGAITTGLGGLETWNDRISAVL